MAIPERDQAMKKREKSRQRNAPPQQSPLHRETAAPPSPPRGPRQGLHKARDRTLTARDAGLCQNTAPADVALARTHTID